MPSNDAVIVRIWADLTELRASLARERETVDALFVVLDGLIGALRDVDLPPAARARLEAAADDIRVVRLRGGHAEN